MAVIENKIPERIHLKSVYHLSHHLPLPLKHAPMDELRLPQTQVGVSPISDRKPRAIGFHLIFGYFDLISSM